MELGTEGEEKDKSGESRAVNNDSGIRESRHKSGEKDKTVVNQVKPKSRETLKRQSTVCCEIF